MIDLHCHFLPGIDDGAESLEEALAMAREAVAQGVTHCAMTPHLHPGRFDNGKWDILEAVHRFQDAIDDHQIALTVTAGAEVRLGLDTLGLVLSGQVPYLGTAGAWKVLLLELPHSGIPVGSLQFVEKLLQAGVRPLIAHPERNKAVMQDIRLIHPFIQAGCWMQVTAGSILGDFGGRSQRTALELLDDDAVHVVASDAHNLEARSPAMGRVAPELERRYGTAACQRLTTLHAAQILSVVVPAENR